MLLQMQMNVHLFLDNFQMLIGTLPGIFIQPLEKALFDV